MYQHHKSTKIPSRKIITVNLCEVIYEMFHILHCGFEIKVSHDHRSFERNLSNCEQKPEKVMIMAYLKSDEHCDDHGLLDC